MGAPCTSPPIAPAVRRSTRLDCRAARRPKRITFEGTYNARPRISADGKELAMVTLDQGNYRIAVQDLQSGAVRVLSRGHLDYLAELCAEQRRAHLFGAGG